MERTLMKRRRISGMTGLNTDIGEQFTGYQIYKDCTDQSGGNSAPRGRKLDGFEIVIIVLFVCQVLTWICGALYD